jgi:hypothetical protein
MFDRWIGILCRGLDGGVGAGALGAGPLILIPLEGFPMAFLAFFWGVELAVAFRIPAGVFKALVLALAEVSLIDSSPGYWVKTVMVVIGMSPSKSGMEEIKLSKACIQVNKLWDFKKATELVMTRVPYRVPFYTDMVGAHLLINRPAGGVFEHLLQELHQVLWSDFLIGFLGQILNSAIFPTQVDLFL